MTSGQYIRITANSAYDKQNRFVSYISRRATVHKAWYSPSDDSRLPMRPFWLSRLYTGQHNMPRPPGASQPSCLIRLINLHFVCNSCPLSLIPMFDLVRLFLSVLHRKMKTNKKKVYQRTKNPPLEANWAYSLCAQPICATPFVLCTCSKSMPPVP